MEKGILSREEIEPPGMRSSSIISDKVEHLPLNYSQRWNQEKITRLGKATPPRIKSSFKIKEFRKKFFPEISSADWNDWRWQLHHRITSLSQLEQIIHVTENERKAFLHKQNKLPFSITPYYASLLDPIDPEQPIRRTVVPHIFECFHTPEESEDPLGEESDSPVPGLVHRYPDRVLFLVTDTCSTYCRYCTRSRIIGNTRENHSNFLNWQKALTYIAANPNIRDVLLSGGDPLILSDEKLEWLLSQLRRIPHVEFLRIGTKIPVVLPYRITSKLTRILKRYHPLWISIHFTHPDELTPEVAQACERLANAGIPLGSQTVLLKGVNDHLGVIKNLVHGLLRVRVRPYYLYQCDPILGSSHFRTPVEKGLEIIRGLRGFTTGYAIPTYVIDAPGGGGKIPLVPDYVAGRNQNYILLRNYKGKIYSYPDPQEIGQFDQDKEGFDNESRDYL